MKKLMIIVALIAGMANVTQAQYSYPIPTEFELTVGQNDSDLCLVLAGSEKEISYQIFVSDDDKGEKKDFKLVGNPIPGTGKPLIFPLPKDCLNITCMIKALNPCGEFEMKNVITTDDIKKTMETIRASKCHSICGMLSVKCDDFKNFLGINIIWIVRIWGFILAVWVLVFLYLSIKDL